MTLDLRDRLADAIARVHVATAATVHPLMEDYRPRTDGHGCGWCADEEPTRTGPAPTAVRA